MAIRLLGTPAEARSFSTLVGRESIMATLTHPALDLSFVREILEVAHKILRYNHHHELASKIMVLEGYLELRRMNPERHYDDRIRKAFDDLTARLQGQIAEMNRKPLHPALALDMSALEVARALLGTGRTRAALLLIKQAMPAACSD